METLFAQGRLTKVFLCFSLFCFSASPSATLASCSIAGTYVSPALDGTAATWRATKSRAKRLLSLPILAREKKKTKNEAVVGELPIRWALSCRAYNGRWLFNERGPERRQAHSFFCLLLRASGFDGPGPSVALTLADDGIHAGIHRGR